MTRLGRGALRLDALVDRRRGLAYAEYFTDASGEDPRADRNGLVRLAELACGDALVRRLAALEQDLRRRVQDSQYDPLFTCNAGACTHPAEMEFDLRGRYTFERDASGRAVLVSVVRIEGGAMTNAFDRAGERWTASRLRSLASQGCP